MNARGRNLICPLNSGSATLSALSPLFFKFPVISNTDTSDVGTSEAGETMPVKVIPSSFFFFLAALDVHIIATFVKFSL